LIGLGIVYEVSCSFTKGDNIGWKPMARRKHKTYLVARK